LAAVQTFVFFFTLVAFISIGVVDVYRRFAMLKVMGVMIDPSGGQSANAMMAMMDDEVTWRPHFIDFTIPSNITSWFATRQVLAEFGLEFKKRLGLYCSYALLLALLLLAKLFYDVIMHGEKSGTSGALVIATITFLSLTIFVILAQMVYYGNAANCMYEAHNAILLRVQMAIRELLSEMANVYAAQTDLNIKAETEELKRSDLLLDSVLKCLQVEDKQNPVTIMGIRASAPVVRSLAGLAVSAAASTMRLAGAI